MKILHIYKTAYPLTYGGIEQMIHQLALGSSAAGIDVKVLCLCDQAAGLKVINKNYRIIYVKKHAEISSMGISFNYLKKFRELATEADIIHYHFPWPFMDLIHFISLIKKPYIVTYHSDIIKQSVLKKLYDPLMWLFLNGANSVIATSPNYKKSSPVLDLLKICVVVIPIGICEDSYKKRLTITKLEEWETKIGRNFCLFLGAMRNYKGLDILLSIDQKLKSNVVVLGPGRPDTITRLRKKISRENNFLFLGALSEDDKVAVLKLCSCVILPSNKRSEAFGVSLLEGALFSKPLISCEIETGTSYVNIDNLTGFVIPPNDRQAMAKAINYLVDNEDHSRIMGKNAYQRYYCLFRASEMTQSYINLYSKYTLFT